MGDSPASGAATGQHVLLLTGAPGCGKTTAIRRLAAAIAPARVGGFLTDEIRESGQRVGFRLETFDGRTMVLARADLTSTQRVGRYGVDVQAFERIAGESLAADAEVFLIDEIGRMECLSPRFVADVTTLLDGGKLVVASIAMRGGGLIASSRSRRDVELWTVTRANRDDIPRRALEWLRQRGWPH